MHLVLRTHVEALTTNTLTADAANIPRAPPAGTIALRSGKRSEHPCHVWITSMSEGSQRSTHHDSRHHDYPPYRFP